MKVRKRNQNDNKNKLHIDDDFIKEYYNAIPKVETEIENLLKSFHVKKYDYKITHFLIDIIQNETLQILRNAKNIKKGIYQTTVKGEGKEIINDKTVDGNIDGVNTRSNIEEINNEQNDNKEKDDKKKAKIDVPIDPQCNDHKYNGEEERKRQCEKDANMNILIKCEGTHKKANHEESENGVEINTQEEAGCEMIAEVVEGGSNGEEVKGKKEEKEGEKVEDVEEEKKGEYKEIHNNNCTPVEDTGRVEPEEKAGRSEPAEEENYSLFRKISSYFTKKNKEEEEVSNEINVNPSGENTNMENNEKTPSQNGNTLHDTSILKEHKENGQDSIDMDNYINIFSKNIDDKEKLNSEAATNGNAFIDDNKSVKNNVKEEIEDTYAKATWNNDDAEDKIAENAPSGNVKGDKPSSTADKDDNTSNKDGNTANKDGNTANKDGNTANKDGNTANEEENASNKQENTENTARNNDNPDGGNNPGDNGNGNSKAEEVLVIDEESVDQAIREYVLKHIYRRKSVDFLYDEVSCEQREKTNVIVERNVKYPSGFPPYLPDDCSINTILPSWDIKYNFNDAKRGESQRRIGGDVHASGRYL
ncbi:hypothetical protein, conserved [Plasmodium ovale curtisi]|uniref:Uncharacterized protein n=1 Tax=Plasmodium ovale curtisi TaxID=864141 RepID=A0A1A8VQU0_PLAOA|nr:hypothetical protein, conserved [Plasmodium ovale curtisi]